MATGLTLSTIREAIAAQLQSRVARDVNVRAYRPAGITPSITVEPASDYLDYWVTFGGAGLTTARFDLSIDAGGSDIESALRRIDDFLSAGTGNDSSVIDALMFDQTLGLVGAAVRIGDVSADGPTAVVSVEVTISRVGSNA